MVNLLDQYLNKPVSSQSIRAKSGGMKIVGRDMDAISAGPLNSDTTNKITPLNPSGKLVKHSIFETPLVMAKGLKNDVVSIGKGMNGKSHDHQLGRINDLGMKAGALGLAAYLMTLKNTPLPKSMELVGAATFFATMALWPKAAIVAPTKIMHGVDIHQKYEDSQGRTKMFFQDPQYVPWDIYTPEQLSKLGDDMKIPKDIQNRDEVTKQEAQKLALQGNTLWMLTAGFATPMITSLTCNRLEKVIAPLQEKAILSKTEKMFKNIDNYASKFVDKKAEKAFSGFITENTGKTVTGEMLDNLSSLLRLDNDTIIRKDNILKDLEEFAKPGTIFDQAAADKTKEMFNIMQPYTSKKAVLEKYLHVRLGDQAETFKANQWDRTTSDFMKSLKLKGNDIEVYKHDKALTRVVKGVKKFFKIKQDPIEQLKNGDMRPLYDSIEKLATGDDKTYQEAIQKLTKGITRFDTTLSAEKFGNGFSTAVDDLTRDFSGQFKGKGFENVARRLHDADSAVGTVNNQLKTAASEGVLDGKACFYRFLQSVDFEKRVASGQLRTQFDAMEANFPQVYGETALKKLTGAIKGGLKPEELAKNIGKDYGHNIGKDFAQALDNEFGKEALGKFFETVSQGKELDSGAKAIQTRMVQIFKNTCHPENFKVDYNEVVNTGRKILRDGNMSGHSTKFKSSVAGDRTYKAIMELVFGSPLDATTKTALKDNPVSNNLEVFQRQFMETVANHKDWANPGRLMDELTAAEGGSPAIRQMFVGLAPDDLVKQTADKTFNTNKFLKTVGIATIALVGVTLTAVALFGKSKKKKEEALINKDDKNAK